MCWTCNPICNRCGKKTDNPQMLMKIKVCPQCGKTAAYARTVCPHCRADIAIVTWDNSLYCHITEQTCDEPCKLSKGFADATKQNRRCPWQAGQDWRDTTAMTP